MRKERNGFTLLEILVALFIFTIIAMLMTRALHTLFAMQSETEHAATRLAKLQMATLLLSQDLEQVIDRPVIVSGGEHEAAFIGTPSSIAFTHGGFSNPLGQVQRSTLQRTKYFLTNHTLMRLSAQSLDETSHTLSNHRDVLAEVTALRFEYIDHQGRRYNRWPSEDASVSTTLPRAVHVFLTMAKWGQFSQWYVIAGRGFEKPK